MGLDLWCVHVAKSRKARVAKARELPGDQVNRDLLGDAMGPGRDGSQAYMSSSLHCYGSQAYDGDLGAKGLASIMISVVGSSNPSAKLSTTPCVSLVYWLRPPRSQW